MWSAHNDTDTDNNNDTKTDNDNNGHQEADPEFHLAPATRKSGNQWLLFII